MSTLPPNITPQQINALRICIADHRGADAASHAICAAWNGGNWAVVTDRADHKILSELKPIGATALFETIRSLLYSPHTALLAAEVDVSTRDYVLTHGKEPRGTGSWAFCPASKYQGNDYLDHTFWTPGRLTYAKARKLAREHFAALGINRIVACT